LFSSKANYQKVVNTAIQKELFTENQIYNYQNDNSNENEQSIFENMFQFYQGNVNRFKKYNISNAIFLYLNDEDSNAGAGIENEIEVVGFNKGLVEKHIYNFLKNENLFNFFDDTNEYERIEEDLGLPFKQLLFQISTHFTFYHELGHLIQKSEYLENGLQEQLVKNTEFDFQKHIFEIDSDTYGTIMSISHILQLFSKYFNTNPNKEDVLKTYGILVAGILIHLFSFESYRLDFYEKMHSHPHVLVRLKNVIQCSNKYFTDALKNYNYNFELDFDTAEKSVLYATEKLSSQLYSEFLIGHFMERNLINETQIEDYLNELNTNLNNTSNAAINIHNKFYKKK